MTASHLIHSMSVVTATYDGSILGVARTRIVNNAIISDHMETTDLERFIHAPTPNGQPGITIHLYSQERGSSHKVPEFLWNQMFDLLCERMQYQAIQRATCCVRHQKTIADVPPAPANPKTKGLVTCLPSDLNTTLIYLDGEHFLEALAGADVPPEKLSELQSILGTMQSNKPAQYNFDFQSGYDPSYKDSPYPDDYDSTDDLKDMPF